MPRSSAPLAAQQEETGHGSPYSSISTLPQRTDELFPLAVCSLCSPEKPRRQPMDPPPPAGQEQSPHRRNVQLLQIDGKVRVHCRYCASSQVSAPAVPSTCPKSVFPTFDRMLSLALVMAMICGHDHHDHHRDPRSRATVAGGPAPAPRPSTPLRRPAPG